MSKKKKKRFGFLKFLFIFILIIGLVYLYGSFIEPKNIKVKEYKISNENITDNFNGFKIVHLSDIHYGRLFELADLKKLVKKVNELKPDIVVITGDLIDRDTKMTTSMATSISDELKNISAESGKYAIAGNHDVNFDEWDNIISNGGFMNLNNNYDTIYKNQKTQNYLNSFEKDGPIYKILLMHEPDYIDDLKDNPYNLILAGHSHGGQVKIPFVGTVLKPDGAKKYYDGHYSLENSDLYVSTGIGVSNINFRLFDPPIINVYRLVK